MIRDFYSLARVHILRKDLLEVVYSPRGGSDDGYDNALILGIKKGKFCIVMEIESVHEFATMDEYCFYNLHLHLKGQNVCNYKMAIDVREYLKSKKGYDRTSNFALTFDRERNIFYNQIKPLNATVDLVPPSPPAGIR